MDKKFIKDLTIAVVGAVITGAISYYVGQQSVQIEFESNESTYVAKLNEKDRDIEAKTKVIESLNSKIKNLETTLADKEAIVCAESIAVNNNKGEYLVDIIEPFDVAGASIINSDVSNSVKVQGKDRRNGFNYNHYQGKMSFNLGKKYKSLTFDFCHVDDSYDSDTNLYIYLDGKQQNVITRYTSDAPKKFIIDVTDVNVIQFKWKGGSDKFALMDMKIYK